jgi:hypothetical protein
MLHCLFTSFIPTMKISRIFKLNKSQAELDFVDVDISTDTPLFIDPFFLSIRSDNWSYEANSTIQSFFQRVIDLIVAGNLREAKTLFTFLKEPNETCLGLSKGTPEGRGVGKTDTDKMFNRIINSKAIETGLVEDLQDNAIFVEKMGKDKLSDMATNIIRRHLIEYTQNQCDLLDIPMVKSPTGYYWDKENEEWHNEYDRMLKVKGKIILLVPKAVVSYNSLYTPQRYHQHFVLDFLQHEHLRLDTVLVRKRRLKNGRISSRVYKKDLKEQVSPYSRDTLRKFTQKHKQILDKFKDDSKRRSTSVSLDKLDNVSIEQVAKRLADSLQKIPTGTNTANDYHNLMLGALDFLFYPHVISPRKETPIHQGRKKIDITFDNAATTGFFEELHRIKKISCQYIFIECKNYTGDPVNPELDQLSGRFSPNRGKFGILTCRQIDNLPLFLERCKDTYQDDRGLIIPLVDTDIQEALEQLQIKNYNRLDEILRERQRLIMMG